MGSLRNRLRRLKRQTKSEQYGIPQQDGTVLYFTSKDVEDAFLNAIERMGAGEDAPERHPLLIAAANSSDPKWRESFFADLDYPGATEPIPDLSE